MSAVQLTRTFSADQFALALESWTWTGIAGLRPAFTSPFGDVFLAGADGLWFLDLIEGKLTRRWASSDALKADLNSPEGQDRYLLAALTFAAERLGIVPSDTPGPELQGATRPGRRHRCGERGGS